MEVDHLGADVHGVRAWSFGDVQTQATVEREHRGRVLHRHRDVIESTDSAALRTHRPLVSAR
jgi:hypothetical protein